MSPAWALLLVAVLIVANGAFVAFEFGLVAARRGLLEEAAANGDRGARAAVDELGRISFVLSSAQFGITATSLIVGFLVEDAIGAAVVEPLLELFRLPAGSRATVAVVLAFTISTVLQMLLGELAPKNYALALPERTASALAIPMRFFGVVLGPVIRLFDTAAAVITERVFGAEVAEERLGGYSPDELTQIIAASREADQLTDEQGELLARAVALGDRRVHEVMVPRTSVDFVAADDTLDDLRAAARRTGHSRFPVRGVDEDDVVGTVHIKDVLAVAPEQRSSTRLGAIASPAVLVPESEPLRRLLARFRGRHRTFAMVIDEYGGVAGIVTVEDVVEELVGEIEDEFDETVGPVRRVGPGRWLLEGTVRTDHASDVLDWEVPDGEYETIAGFLIDRLGRIPRTGSSVRMDGLEFVAQRVDGVRVAQVLVRRHDQPVDGASDVADADVADPEVGA